MPTLRDTISATERCNSLFENAVRRLDTPVCACFRHEGGLAPVRFSAGKAVPGSAGAAAIDRLFPKSVEASDNRILAAAGRNTTPPRGKRVAVLFSGGPAAGGHNVLAGMARVLGAGNTLVGVRSGPKGLLAGDVFDIDAAAVARIVNTGGFDFLGSDRTKIKTDEQFAGVARTCKEQALDAVTIIGGDDSNTNAAVLAERLFAGVHPDGRGVQVIGLPKTIDGDLQAGEHLPISFGFDTATKTYAEMVGNILQDTPSSRKYWHFVKVMGRSASHVALEVALQTKPPVALISEEVAQRRMSLAQIVERIAAVVVARARAGMNYGLVLIPEGIIEAVPEMTALIGRLNDTLAGRREELAGLDGHPARRRAVNAHLSDEHAALLDSLPDYIAEMLLAERDSHGNLQVSLIPTERLLIDMTARRVRELDPQVPFKTQSHFFGYEGRCGAPTLFDAAYTYNLGMTAASLILDGRTGYMASLTELDRGGTPLALPLTGLLTIERRHGEEEMVIAKALVEMDSPAFAYFAERRDHWAAADVFASPGPRQLWGPASRQLPLTVALNLGCTSLDFSF